ncbi:endolytic transglycosylase MltG [Leptolyngbya sp. O-77]|uniref:endolytic transglycosylase MltG n=1 Tax=Leptolyngbya sp. O-77 TaxID=1080068 RepID=UPI00074D2A45|nr:endolytic transglycosylase MltG [Leptolyngbya sp. O-77]BAU43693.1 putative aminodeoxychorismate lyase [Leptolyngbya sp. O-77]
MSVKRLSGWSKGLILLTLVLLALLLGGWQGWRWWLGAIAPATSTTDSGDPLEGATERGTVQVKIPPGSTAQQIGETLKAQGIIRSTQAWNLWTRWQTVQKRPGSFQAGTYALSPAEPLPAIADQIWRGEVVQNSFTIPEGWTIRQMAEYFEEQGYFPAEEFMAAAQDIPRDRFPWLPENLPILEGFLFPDTYQFAGELTPELAIDQMLRRFEQVALPIYDEGRSPYSFMEWVTLASIVEKEAVVQEERPTIASVFARRLREGIPLAADPTVEYGLGIRQTVEQPLTYAQVRQPSPYNTYINPGLTPTPIAAPGLASLEASLNPGDTEYLFFMARYDGTHIFSRTLAEHEAAKRAVDAELSRQN